MRRYEQVLWQQMGQSRAYPLFVLVRRCSLDRMRCGAGRVRRVLAAAAAADVPSDYEPSTDVQSYWQSEPGADFQSASDLETLTDTDRVSTARAAAHSVAITTPLAIADFVTHTGTDSDSEALACAHLVTHSATDHLLVKPRRPGVCG